MLDSNCKVIAITGGKGGVGKTTFSVNLGSTLANLGHNTVILDADFGLANVDIVLGLRPQKAIHSVLTGDSTIDEILLPYKQNLSIIPGGSGQVDMANLTSSQVSTLIELITGSLRKPEFLLIDTAAGISKSVVELVSASDEVVVVVCNDPASIADAYALIKVLNLDYNIHKFRVLFNMVKVKEESEEVFAKLTKVTDRFLNVSLCPMGTILYDHHWVKALRKYKTVVDAHPDSKVTSSLYALAKKVLEWPKQTVNGRMQFYMQDLVER